MSNNESTIIEATLFWPFLGRVNDMSGKYQVDLGNLSSDAVKALEGMGLTVRTDEPKEDKPDRGKFVTAKSKFPFKVLFKNGVEVVDINTIGNGTVANVKIGPYHWKFKNKEGISASAQKFQITDLVKYEGSGEDDEDFPDSTSAPAVDTDFDDDFED